MSALEFIQSLCILATVAGLVVYLTRTIVAQRALKFRLAEAVTALAQVEKIRSDLGVFETSASKTLTDHETKLSALSLKVGFR